ncbi:(d)CMP kinase [Corynebacterium phocae]|uniref:(d)CMP kinase n=1 Tax=Corynebacterium phocae TaxID=161895 RepID=UPI000951B7EA|nr:(d)CMP kinase [Corynebacterium phocae]
MTLTVLIDGPSGSGKTTLAGDLASRLGARVVHLDDFYPGWSGLAAASRQVADSVLAGHLPGYRRWDWENDRPGQWVALDPGEDLIVEGVGALSAGSLRAAAARGAVVSVVIDAPARLRQRRAFDRDAEDNYGEFWQMWARQEKEHFARWAREGVVPDLLIGSGSNPPKVWRLRRPNVLSHIRL